MPDIYNLKNKFSLIVRNKKLEYDYLKLYFTLFEQ